VQNLTAQRPNNNNNNNETFSSLSHMHVREVKTPLLQADFRPSQCPTPEWIPDTVFPIRVWAGSADGRISNRHTHTDTCRQIPQLSARRDTQYPQLSTVMCFSLQPMENTSVPSSTSLQYQEITTV
jgi:hypothetical protein